jgi:hypothetical protein
MGRSEHRKTTPAFVMVNICRAHGQRLTASGHDPNVRQEQRAADTRLRYDLYVRWLFRMGRARERVQSVATPRGTE